MTNLNPGNDPLVAIPEEPKRPSGCRIVLTLLVVFALLFMSASGAIWFFFFREQPQPDEIDAPIVEATAVPPEPTEETNEEAEMVVVAPTAVPINSTSGSDNMNRIVYITDDGQVVALAPDGTDQRQLTDGSFRFQFPAWSPDGRSVAVIGLNRSGAGLFVLADEVESGITPQPLYADREQGPFYLYWSPDSSQVSFLASHPDGMGLHLVQADGSADSRLLTVGGPLYWQWTANSEQMLIHSGFSGDASRLELISAMGDGMGDAIASPGFFQAPGISTDGRYLAYAEAMSGNSSLVVIDTESEDEVQERHAGQVAMTWSPSSNQLAFTNGTEPGSRSFVGPLRLLDAATGEVKLISNEPILAFFWSPNGRYLAAISALSSGEGDINAWLDGKPDVFKSNQQQNLPRLRLLVYDLLEDEGRALFNFVPTFSFATQFLPFFDQYALSHRLWSPNSDALLLPMVEDGQNQIFIINIVTGQKQFLAEGTMPFWSPR